MTLLQINLSTGFVVTRYTMHVGAYLQTCLYNFLHLMYNSQFTLLKTCEQHLLVLSLRVSSNFDDFIYLTVLEQPFEIPSQ